MVNSSLTAAILGFLTSLPQVRTEKNQRRLKPVGENYIQKTEWSPINMLKCRELVYKELKGMEDDVMKKREEEAKPIHVELN